MEVVDNVQVSSCLREHMLFLGGYCCLGSSDRCIYAIGQVRLRQSTYSLVIFFFVKIRFVSFFSLEAFYKLLPWIFEPLRVSAGVIRLTAVVPGTDFSAFDFAWIESCDQILFARASQTARFARDGVMAPCYFSFFVSFMYNFYIIFAKISFFCLIFINAYFIFSKNYNIYYKNNIYKNIKL